MPTRNLPLNTWIVVEQRSPGSRARLISTHLTQTEAEADRDRRNKGLAEPVFAAWIVLEPVAQRMGGRQAPTTAARDPSTQGDEMRTTNGRPPLERVQRRPQPSSCSRAAVGIGGGRRPGGNTARRFPRLAKNAWTCLGRVRV